MKKKSRPKENLRKQRRRSHNRPNLQFVKQLLYYRQHGVWIDDPRRLHWHHRDPRQKYKKISWLSARSGERIARELVLCDVVLDAEHRLIHRGGNHGVQG